MKYNLMITYEVSYLNVCANTQKWWIQDLSSKIVVTVLENIQNQPYFRDIVQECRVDDYFERRVHMLSLKMQCKE